ncbi:unnamed protein product [Gongylonema pulchrum]|uniref:Nucleoporin_N domain-containing protein n=1 Tax=Gongylonema pulchrum TaxID=637853 RepID=A0A183CX21_9BILA|nr:unnamed protein product [Gongylonema pulchrum]
MYLLPNPIFKVPLEGSTLTDIATSPNGRIFFAADGNVFEIDYQEKGWFGQRCRKINHSKSFISYFLPVVPIIGSKEDRLVQLCMDDSRNILYSLSENGSIQVYDLQLDGNAFVKVASMGYEQIQEIAAMECRTVDASFFANVVQICSIPYTQSRLLHLHPCPQANPKVAGLWYAILLFVRAEIFLNPSQLLE